MNSILNKLSVRTTDYVACIDVEDNALLSHLHKYTKGVVCCGKIGKNNFDELKNIRVVKKAKNLDEGIFNKVVAIYSDELNIKNLVKIADDFGLVLLCDVPEDRGDLFEALLANKAGIFDYWRFNSGRKGTIDILFKVRKHE